MQNKKAHPLSFLVLYFFSICPLLLSPKLYINLIYGFVPLFIYLYYEIDFKKFFNAILASIIPSISYLIMVLFFGDLNLKNGDFYNLHFYFLKFPISFIIYKKLFIYALAGSIRIFLLSIISFSTTLMINITELFKFLMIKKIISFKYGYSFSIALNSIPVIIDEIKRINFLMKNRGIKPFYKGFLPILVYGIRYSELAAISLISRGFSEDRTVFNYEKPKKNEVISFSLIGFMIFLMLLMRN